MPSPTSRDLGGLQQSFDEAARGSHCRVLAVCEPGPARRFRSKAVRAGGIVGEDDVLRPGCWEIERLRRGRLLPWRRGLRPRCLGAIAPHAIDGAVFRPPAWLQLPTLALRDDGEAAARQGRVPVAPGGRAAAAPRRRPELRRMGPAPPGCHGPLQRGAGLLLLLLRRAVLRGGRKHALPLQHGRVAEIRAAAGPGPAGTRAAVGRAGALL
ncbi:unnamed protein product, partial [Prorocentrum cordatum]